MADWSGSTGTATAQRYTSMAAHAAPLSPTYEQLCLGVAADPEVIARLDTLSRPKRQPNLLLGAVRFLDGPVDRYGAFRTFVLRRWDDVSTVMRERRTQTNEPLRTATMLPVLSAVPQPVALLEVGASAGLCLYPDRYAYRYDDRPVLGRSSLVLGCSTSGPVPFPVALPEVSWRGGLDLEPLDLSDPTDLRWLESLIWPEETGRVAALHAAAAIALSDPAHIERGDLTRDLEMFVAQVPDAATLAIVHSAVLAYLDDDGRAAMRAQVARIAARRPTVWLSNESPGVVVPAADCPDAGPAEFVLARDGAPLALAESHGARLRWLAAPTT